ncbi:response regulator [Geothrix sp. PMB-07]|uniref:ATP-binding response regulator n=1 Tax=Geothrix sp. PMB-07 TaxID=3068640 RepID=UPI00274281E5|nr:response regulator [Geothrix sp. PMB-07]WLT32624.1 response regulator [Geothrix sp. PMB-07]
MSQPQILIVEDEAIVAMDLKLHLQDLGYGVAGLASTGEESISLAASQKPGLVLMDISLGAGMDGIEAARYMQAMGIPVVFLTAFADEVTLKRAKDSAPYGYLLKPFDERTLHSTIEMALYRHRMEQELKASESRMRSIIEHALDLVVILDQAGRVSYSSPAAAKILGYTYGERYGLPAVDLIHPDDQETYLDVLRELVQTPGASRTLEIRVMHRNGSPRLMEVVTHNALDVPGVHGIVINARDITERRQAEIDRQIMESKVQQAQKLESLGVMAGGIAHDFNNLLMGIMGHAGLALMEISGDSPLRRRLHQIEVAATRAAELTNQLLAYSGRGTFQVEPLSLPRLVDEMEGLLETVISKKAQLEHRYSGDLPLIDGDGTQIRQVIMNVITNASDALEDRPGTITISIGTQVTGPLTPCLAGTPPEGESVFLEVADTGSGMEPDTLERIFDPFFTTKFTGRGLGLAAVLGIVRGHHGAIQVTSRPDEGTAVRLYFPRSKHTEGREVWEDRPTQSYQSEGLVLVVDDEEAVRSVASSTLERCGFTVLTATNGRDGLKVYREHADRIRAVVLDLTMPIMSGDEVLADLRGGPAPGSTVPVLLSSGYSSSDVAGNLQRYGTIHFLQKPYNPGDLTQKIRTCLGE